MSVICPKWRIWGRSPPRTLVQIEESTCVNASEALQKIVMKTEYLLPSAFIFASAPVSHIYISSRTEELNFLCLTVGVYLTFDVKSRYFLYVASLEYCRAIDTESEIHAKGIRKMRNVYILYYIVENQNKKNYIITILVENYNNFAALSEIYTC